MGNAIGAALLAIDPGKTTGCVLVDLGQSVPVVRDAWEAPGGDLDEIIPSHWSVLDALALEVPESAGLGRTDGGGAKIRVQPLLDTALLCGRILERWRAYTGGAPAIEIPRRQVVSHFGAHRGAGNRDSRIRAALLMAYGGEKRALGTSKQPGPLALLPSSGGHKWAAMAVALASEAAARAALRGRKATDDHAWHPPQGAPNEPGPIRLRVRPTHPP